MGVIGKNTKQQVTIDGVARFLSCIYDSGFAGSGGNDMAGHVAARNYGRYNFDCVIHTQSGSVNNGLRLCDAVLPYNMYVLAIGNFFGNFTFDPAFFTPGSFGFDVTDSATFRSQFAAKPNSIAIYMADEPAYSPSGYYSNSVLAGGNYQLTSNLNGWTPVPASDGSVAWNSGNGGQCNLVGGSTTNSSLVGTGTVSQGQQTKWWIQVRAGTLTIQITSGPDILYASGPLTTGTYNGYVTPTSTSIQMTVQVGPSQTASFDNVGISRTGDPPPVPSSRGKDCCVTLQNHYKTVIPSLPTWTTFLNDDGRIYREWYSSDIGDWCGSDIYVFGQGPELYLTNDVVPSTYGYMSWPVCEAAALARYFGMQSNRVPNIVLEANKFGATSRFQTRPESISHLAMSLGELWGRGVVTWWSLGVQAGAIDEVNATDLTGNGTNKVFTANNLYAEEAVDVVVKVGGAVQPQSAYTNQNLGDRTINKSGNFWVYTNPAQVTLNTAPGSGVAVRIEVQKWPATRKAMIKQFLEDASKLIRQYEQVFLNGFDQTFITNNTTWAADFLSWRIPYCDRLRDGSVDRPTWLFGSVSRYQSEYDSLRLSPPNYQYSVHMQDQRGHVRANAYVGASYAIVAAYNIYPDAQNNVSLTFKQAAVRCEVLLENRDVPLTNGGKTITDTFGGASALRQGPFGTGHIYKLYFTGVAPQPPRQAGGCHAFRGQVLCGSY